jgi:hypothetical protein
LPRPTTRPGPNFEAMTDTEARKEIDSTLEKLERGEISAEEGLAIARAARARVTRIRHARDSLKLVQKQFPAEQVKGPDPIPLAERSP